MSLCISTVLSLLDMRYVLPHTLNFFPITITCNIQGHFAVSTLLGNYRSVKQFLQPFLWSRYTQMDTLHGGLESSLKYIILNAKYRCFFLHSIKLSQYCYAALSKECTIKSRIYEIHDYDKPHLLRASHISTHLQEFPGIFFILGRIFKWHWLW